MNWFNSVSIARLFALLISVFFGVSAHAATLTMDFDGQGLGSAPTVYSENGIRLTGQTPNPNRTLFNLGNPSPGYALNDSTGSYKIELISGGAFSMGTIDLTTQFSVTWDIVAGLFGGGTLMGSLTTDSNGNSFETFDLSTYSNISWITISQTAGRMGAAFIDNISLSDVAPVPLPATGWFLVAGLGCLALRRKNNVATTLRKGV